MYKYVIIFVFLKINRFHFSVYRNALRTDMELNVQIDVNVKTKQFVRILMELAAVLLVGKEHIVLNKFYQLQLQEN